MAKRLKVAFLNITFGKVERGAETFVLELSKRLRKDYTVDIISGDSLPGSRWPVLWRFFIDPHGLSILWFTLKNLPRILKERYDIVIPIDGGWEPAIIRLATWLYGGKMIISGQSGIGWDDRNNLWSFPDTFVALSTFAKNWAKKANPSVKVEHIPNGVDPKKFTFKGGTLQGKPKKPMVLCVGALTETKRIDLAIKVVARLKDVSLLVVGDGVLKGKLQGLGNRMLGGRFKITKLPFKKMPEVYRTADVFTIPSESYYSFEIVLAEAMASGLSVVANNDPIRREIVGDAGILVDPTNTEAYAAALKKALDTNWGDKPRCQAEKFDWNKIVKEYERLFLKITK